MLQVVRGLVALSVLTLASCSSSGGGSGGSSSGGSSATGGTSAGGGGGQSGRGGSGGTSGGCSLFQCTSTASSQCAFQPCMSTASGTNYCYGQAASAAECPSGTTAVSAEVNGHNVFLCVPVGCPDPQTYVP